MKKRSLFVATAMLLVAVLVATGATYAWFSDLGNASTTITMDVANGDSLEISVDNKNWQTSLTNASFVAGTQGMSADLSKGWVDLSTTNNQLGSFYDEIYDNTQATTITGYQPATGKVAYATVYFRSTKAGDVKLTSSALSATISGPVFEALRVGVVDGEDKYIFANAVDTNNKAIQSVTTEGTTTYEANGTQTTARISDDTVIVKMSKAQDAEYFTGNATFYFWVEGTKCSNKDAAADKTATAAMTFALAQ